MANTRKNKVYKKSKTYSIENIIIFFLQISNSIKMYHWKTHSYAEHKATDDLYSKIGDDIDKFIEVLLGKMNGQRFNVGKFITSDYKSVDELKRNLNVFKKYLMDMSDGNSPLKMHTDLINIRDEILGDIDQFMYLLTLK